MSHDTLLRPLLSEADSGGPTDDRRASIARALTVDPALRSRVRCHDDGVIVLSDLNGRTPSSTKERERWQLHVRLRLAAELGTEVADAATIRWTDSSMQVLGSDHLDSDGLRP